MEGLTANLISTSQLCDQGFSVSFSKDNCTVTNSDNTVVMSGIRSSDDCYFWTSDLTSNVCNSIRNNKASLWHKRLGHINLRSVMKAITKEAILGIPKL